MDFALQQPCGDHSRLIVASVHTDLVPGDPPQTRVTFVVMRGDDRAFMLSETRTLLAFTAIPQSTRRVAVDGDGVRAEGFAGPSGSGGEISYLRWRTREVTYELSATLEHWQTLADVESIALAMMERTVGAGPR